MVQCMMLYGFINVTKNKINMTEEIVLFLKT